ncbi:hypothetical protein [Kitasatospora cinereorecta]|uniref:Uncharacterized protein n=1 Tax=Kitasatospora cinereorecta TaxID=285560 RepID=A0ABW0V956_9ACTN
MAVPAQSGPPALTVRPRPGPDHNVLDAVGALDQDTAERRSGC